MRNFFILLFTLCFVMCAPRQSDNTISVDLDHPEKASLFDYFSSIELIPLETSSDALVQALTKVVEHDDKYYALDKPNVLFLCLIRPVNFYIK